MRCFHCRLQQQTRSIYIWILKQLSVLKTSRSVHSVCLYCWRMQEGTTVSHNALGERWVIPQAGLYTDKLTSTPTGSHRITWPAPLLACRQWEDLLTPQRRADVLNTGSSCCGATVLTPWTILLSSVLILSLKSRSLSFMSYRQAS